jgi:metallo-beta-lactamase class B
MSRLLSPICGYICLLLLTCPAISQAKIAQTKIAQIKNGQTKTSMCSQCAEWNKAQAPFRIFGNSYFVGTHGLSSVLITSKAGHVLIDGDLPESAKQIVANIQSLGFRIEDVKIILNSHVHFDHAGGIAELQRLSGARVMASTWSAAVMKHGGMGRDDPQFVGGTPIEPVANVHTLQDGQTLRVGDIAITAHLTPGHTPGGTSWTWKSCEDNVCYDMVYADSLTPVSADGFKFTTSREYPQALSDFEKSFAFLETTPCDILITTHPEASELWDRLEVRQNKSTPDPMINAGACRELAAQGRKRLQQRIAEEKAQKAAN